MDFEDFSVVAFGGEEGLVGGDDFAEVVLSGDFVDVLGWDFVCEGEGKLVAPHEVDAIEMLVIDGNPDGTGDDDEPGGDEGRFAVFKEVEMGFLEEGDGEDLVHELVFDGQVEEEAAYD